MNTVRSDASVLHLDLDAFFAAVEQRDKPSLRGKAVVVGGVGQRGVVATASYEARVFGVRSAMPAHEARRRCPNAAFLSPRFAAYQAASAQVMGVLRDLSPLVEPLSLDEAFVDLRTATRPVRLDEAGLTELVHRLKADVAAATGGLRASVGVGSSKFVAKLATELDKPDGLCIVAAGTEVDLIAPLKIEVLPGVGPVTTEKLHRIGLRTVADLRAIGPDELVRTVGRAHGQALIDLAYARDDRAVEAEREAKSISVENTFETDLTDRGRLERIIDTDADQVARRLNRAGLFARTVTIKVRMHDFSTATRSRTVSSPTDRGGEIAEVARELLQGVDVTNGIRLLGVGVAGLSEIVQERLFELGPDVDVAPGEEPAVEIATVEPVPTIRASRRYPPGADVVHHEHGAGWVWGSGLGRVTVRFETRDTGPGPVRTFGEDDPALRVVEPQPYEPPQPVERSQPGDRSESAE